MQRRAPGRVAAQAWTRGTCSALLGLALAGCPSEDPPAASSGSSGGAQVSKTTKLRAEAHAETLQRLLPLVREVATLEDPITASTRLDVAPQPPPVTAGKREALRKALEAASREAKGLDASVLAEEQRVVALASRFVLDRARDALTRRRPYRDDPTWITTQVGDVLDLLEARSRASGACGHCAASLPATKEAVEAAKRELAASSMPAAAAARDDARVLAGRVRTLPEPSEPHEALAIALEGFADHLDAVIVALPDATAVKYGEPLGTVDGPHAVRRLPPRLGLDELRRRLEVQENVARSPAEFMTAMGRTIPTLSAMAAKRAKHMGTDPKPQAVTVERCNNAWATLQPLATKHAPEAAEAFTCETFVRGLGTTTLREAELPLTLLNTTVAEPMRIAAQKKLPEALALVGGRLARAGQAHTLRTALLLSPPEDPKSAAASLWLELDAACLATAAIWVHGELGDEAALDKRLSKHCPRPTPVLIEEAQARPRQALRGLAISRVSQGPAGVVTLDHFWWLPLGLVDVVADPTLSTPKPAVPVKVDVETIAP